MVILALVLMMAGICAVKSGVRRQLRARAGGGADTQAAFWRRWAGLYDGFMRSSGPLYNRMAALMRERLRPDMNALELCCGTGMLSERIAGCVCSLEATDYAPEMIEQAKRKPCAARVRFGVQDATALPYAPQTFDAVIIANALHIMPEPERALAEIRRVLRADGVLIAPTFVHGEGLGFRLRARAMALAGFRVSSRWNAQQLEAFIAANGFDVTRRALMGGRIAPLCYVEATPAEEGCA